MYKCYKGNTLIKKIYHGSIPIKKIYKGSQLVWQDAPYDINTVIFEQATPGTYQVNLLGAGSYEVYCVAGGGRGGYVSSRRPSSGKRFWAVYGGGSGSAFVGIVKLSQGLLSITVGNNDTSRNSSIGNLITTYGGGDPRKIATSTSEVGHGGAIPTINTQIISQQINAKGNDGSSSGTPNISITCPGGASLFNNYGQGGIGQANGLDSNLVLTTFGTSGYVKIVYKGE